MIHKPRKMQPIAKKRSPMFWYFFLVASKRMNPPIKTAIERYSAIGIEIINEVTVVPTFAPMMIGAAAKKERTPARTMPIVRAVVPPLDWMIAVKAAPVRKPVKRFPEHLSMILDKPPSAIFLMTREIELMPKRKRPKPARTKNQNKGLSGERFIPRYYRLIAAFLKERFLYPLGAEVEQTVKAKVFAILIGRLVLSKNKTVFWDIFKKNYKGHRKKAKILFSKH